MPKKEERLHPCLDIDSRLSLSDRFQFSCGPHVSCFTECCGKLELLLTPYDLLRLRTRLGISSSDFLDAHTTMRWNTPHGFPEVLLNMDRGEENRCPFVTSSGCTVYEDRPGACRIYPLGRASTSSLEPGTNREFYFVVREDHCRGFEQALGWEVGEWLQDQGMEPYNQANDLLMELYVRKARLKKISLGPQHMKMFVMACYNTERFRDFIFKSAFLNKFQIPADVTEQIRTNDFKLLDFAFLWLKFALFGEPVMSIRDKNHFL